MSRLRDFKDAALQALVLLLASLALVPLLHLVATVVVEGLPAVLEAGPRFFTDVPPPPYAEKLEGGIAPAIAGSLLLLALSLPLTVLLALGAAVLTTEFPEHPLSRVVDAVARSLASVPTIVVSMAVYCLVVVPLARMTQGRVSFCAAAGALALTVVALPYAYTALASAIRSVPHTYREAGFALGMTRRQVLLKVVIPIARRALAAGVLLTSARIMGETAALLFTVGGARSSVELALDKPVDAISLLIFVFAWQVPSPLYEKIAWGAALVLLAGYLATFLAVKLCVKEVKL